MKHISVFFCALFLAACSASVPTKWLAPPPAAPTLASAYPSKQALLAELERIHFQNQVNLDGARIWNGFGPWLEFRSNPDGTVSR